MDAFDWLDDITRSPGYYNRAGERITARQWAERHSAGEGVRVALTSWCDRNGNALVDVSTVWLGLDHQWGTGPPLIFETMTFSALDELDCGHMRRYSTEADARAGHELVVSEVRRHWHRWRRLRRHDVRID